jgi:hypothetical protein
MSTLGDISRTVNSNVLTPISQMLPGDLRGRMPGGMEGLTSNLTSSVVSVGKTALIYAGMVAAGAVGVVGSAGALGLAIILGALWRSPSGSVMG